MSVFRPSMSGSEQRIQRSFSPPVITATKIKVNKGQSSGSVQKRKTRSDKKTDIKVPVTIVQKQKLMVLAKIESVRTSQRISVTQIGSRLVQNGLFEQEDFPVIQYEASLKPVHVKLEQFYVDQLFNHQMEWDVSMREAAARVLSYMLEMSDHDEL